MPGPPPKHPSARARRNSTSNLILLKPGLRDADTPPWPLPADLQVEARAEGARSVLERVEAQLAACTDGRRRKALQRDVDEARQAANLAQSELDAVATMEGALWAEVWSTPQAKVWEELCWTREVAQYVRWKVRGELGDMRAAQEARQWSDRLGLNPMAMLKLRMEIERVGEAEERAAQRQGRAQRRPAAAAGGDPRRALQ